MIKFFERLLPHKYYSNLRHFFAPLNVTENTKRHRSNAATFFTCFTIMLAWIGHFFVSWPISFLVSAGIATLSTFWLIIADQFGKYTLFNYLGDVIFSYNDPIHQYERRFYVVVLAALIVPNIVLISHFTKLTPLDSLYIAALITHILNYYINQMMWRLDYRDIQDVVLLSIRYEMYGGPAIAATIAHIFPSFITFYLLILHTNESILFAIAVAQYLIWIPLVLFFSSLRSNKKSR